MPKKYIQGFPRATATKTAQQVMAEWQEKYKFDPVKKQWYEEVAEAPGAPDAPIAPIVSKDVLQKEAPETLIEPTREQFTTDFQYQTALQKFKTTGSWATPAPETGEIGTWIDFKTGQGYSGPKRNPQDTSATPGVVPEAPIPPSPTLPPKPLEKPPEALPKAPGVETVESIKTKIADVQTRISEATSDLERETAIQSMVELMASMGLDYPTEVITALTKPPEETEEELRTKLYEDYGIEDLEDKFKEKPEQTFEEIYSSAYSDLKLGELKLEIDKIRKDVAKTEEERDERISDINENPWLSEASRVGRIRRDTADFEAKLSRLNNQLVLIDNLYSRGREEAENVAARALNTFVREREWSKEELQFYIQRAEADLEAKMAMREVEVEKLRFRYYPEWTEKYQEFKEGEKLEEREEEGTKTEKEIVSAVKGMMTAYKLNPKGFREKAIENLVSRYGSGHRKFITDNIYQYLPNIIPKKNGEESDFYDDL